MYYDRLKQRVRIAAAAKAQQNGGIIPITDCIAPAYLPIHNDIIAGQHETYHLPGGRGSCKSSFCALEIVNGIMQTPGCNAVVFRRVAATMRESVFSQIAWAIEMLGASALWRGCVSPMQYTYKPTGQQIIFRGLDDPAKLKSIKPRSGYFKYIWFEEFSELTGANMVRSVLQSVMRGGTGFVCFNSFNPPLSVNAWANKYIEQPNEKALVFRSTFQDVPPEWLGEAFLLEAERLQSVNEKAYQHEYLGIPTGSGGEVFPNITAQALDDDFIKAQLQYIYCGLDFGFSVDPVCFIRVAYDSKTQTVYFLDEIYKRGLSNAALADLIKEKGFDSSGREYVSALGNGFSRTAYPEAQQIICDSAEPKSIADLRESGLKAIACRKYAGSVLYGIRWLQTKQLVFDPRRTPNAYREFTEYEYCTTKDGEFLADVPDGNNHAIDACRYALDRLINSRKYTA